jgi:hypothetical protein
MEHTNKKTNCSLFFKILLPTLAICVITPTVLSLTSCSSTTSKKRQTYTEFTQTILDIGTASTDEKHNKETLCKGKGNFTSSSPTDKAMLKQAGKAPLNYILS